MTKVQELPNLRLCVFNLRSRADGFSAAWNEHPFYEIGLVMEGTCTWHFKHSRSRQVKMGHAILLKPHCVHREEASGRVQLSWVGFELAADPGKGFALRSIPLGESDQSFRHLVQQIYEEQHTQRFASTEVCHLALRQLWLLFLRACQTRAPQDKSGALNARQMQIVQSLAAHLDQNATQPLSLDQVAGYHNLSAAHLSALFQRCYKITPTTYRIRKRLEHAQELLAGTSLRIKEIAAACGFTDSAHFCKEFKRQTGRTPNEARLVPVPPPRRRETS